MSLNQSLNWRYAVKHFNRQSISHQQLTNLIESVRLAPSAFGLQPFKLMVVESALLKAKLTPACFEQPQITSCSHVFVFAAKTRINRHDIDEYIFNLARTQQSSVQTLAAYKSQIETSILSLTAEQQQKMAEEQTYIALGTLLAAAAIYKIDTCPMTGFDIARVNEILALTEQGLSASVICPVGFRAADDPNAKRAKYRQSQPELVVNL